MPSPDAPPPGHDPDDPNAIPDVVGARLATFLMGWPLTMAFAVWCLIIIACWIPNYLNLPWFTDHDHFAMIAQRWSAGFLPYRDTFTIQFPGEIYFFYLLGKLVGWGNSVAFYAIDAGMVLVFLGLLLAWGRKKSGRWLPGMVGITMFLDYYTNQTFAVAGQRDWHGMFFALMSLFLLDFLPGRAGRIVSGIAYGIALAFRPQFALLGPALAIALTQQKSETKSAVRRTLFAWLEWASVAAVVLAVSFAPLMIAGVFGDLLRCLKTISYGSNYNSRSVSSRIYATFRELAVHPAPIAVLLGIFCLRSGRIRPFARETWIVTLALLGMIFYSTISPIHHAYYQIPIYATLALATTFALTLVRPGWVPSKSSAIAVLLIGVTWQYPGIPIESAVAFVRDLRGSQSADNSDGEAKPIGPIRAMRFARNRQLPEKPPLGWLESFVPSYRWDTYRRLIVYLRDKTSPETPVAVFLFDCITAVNGAVPRLSPLPADAADLVAFPEFLNIDIAALEAVGPCVVVIDPSDQEAPKRVDFVRLAPKLKPLMDVIHRDFRLETTIGPFEVWRKVGSEAAGTPVRPGPLSGPPPSGSGRN